MSSAIHKRISWGTLDRSGPLFPPFFLFGTMNICYPFSHINFGVFKTTNSLCLCVRVCVCVLQTIKWCDVRAMSDLRHFSMNFPFIYPVAVFPFFRSLFFGRCHSFSMSKHFRGRMGCLEIHSFFFSSFLPCQNKRTFYIFYLFIREMCAFMCVP